MNLTLRIPKKEKLLAYYLIVALKAFSCFPGAKHDRSMKYFMKTIIRTIYL